MADGLPTVDDRRASALRDELSRNAQMLAPDWAGLAQEGDFGRALLEIAARLAEHSTSGLDKTPLRDKLAFLDALDVATPAPQPATAPIVFTLAEKRDTMVFAPARVQLTAKQGKDELTFETRDAIDITPARIAELIVADPATDTIERAPGFVTRSVDSPPLATSYLLLSAVEAKNKMIQLVQSVGIAPGDLLRLAGSVYRVDTVKGGIVQLLDTLGRSAPAGATVEKLIALESFALRNLQEHAVYFGHKEMLKLDGPAEITLVFDPPTLPALLAGLDLEYSIWGRLNADADPDWQALDLRGAGPAGLVLAKTWPGSVEELKLPAGKSRWLRMRLRTPIAGACGPATGAVSVKLAVRSTKPAADANSEGSETIGAAFYNSQPLPTATAFFPFGPEPQRFDTFAFSAPEALSKKGAVVTIAFTFDDASLQTLAYDRVAPDYVYGVSGNGRLQSIRFSASSHASWRQLGTAPVASGAAGAGSVRLDPDKPLDVLHATPALDLVFVCGKDGVLRIAKVTTTGENWGVSEWTSLPYPGSGAFTAFCLIPDPGSAAAPPRSLLMALAAVAISPVAYLFGAGDDGCHVRAIGPGGTFIGDWVKLNASPPVAAMTALAIAKPDFDAVRIAAVTKDGAAFDGIVNLNDLANPTITWTALDLGGAKASSTIPPAAFIDEDGKLVLVAASEVEKPADPTLIVVGASPDAAAVARVGAPQSIALLPVPDAGSEPLVVMTGTTGILIWAGDIAESTALPADSDPAKLHVLLRRGGAVPRLLIAAASERVLVGTVSMGASTSSAELIDRLYRSQSSPKPTHVLMETPTSSAIHALSDDWMDDGTLSVRTAPHNDAKAFLLLDMLAPNLTGQRLQDRQLELDASDTQTAEDDVIEIAGEVFTVTGKTTNKVTLDADMPAGTSLAYAVYRPVDGPKVTLKKADRKRFARLASAPPAPAIELAFESPAKPRKQEVAAVPHDWLLLKKPWVTLPSTATVQATVLAEPGITIDTDNEIRLPRDTDNPELSWEYFDGDGWRRLERDDLNDRTGNFARSDTVSFTVPPGLTQTEIAGKEDYWLRVRLIGGDYGRPIYDIVSDPAVAPSPSVGHSKTSITIDRSQLNPPEILSIEASYVLNTSVPLDVVVAGNNLAAIDQTQAAQVDGAVFDLFEGVAQHVGDADGGTRALYIGLGKRPDVQALRFYADILDRNTAGRKLVAEALIATGWKPIGVQDETGGLTHPGMIQLDLVPSPEQLPLFGKDGWWLRLRPKDDAADWAPVIRGLFVNAVTAEHAKTVTKELLGSSLGDPDQRLQLAQKPVLQATLDLRVLESLGEEERAAIAATFGAGAIAEDPEQRGVWVRWANVTTFVDSDGDARVYRLDPASGEVQFGDGRSGKVPPAGRDSIRAFFYQWGGGSAGNVPAQAIAKLTTALESVDLAMNPVDAAGGADAPRVERLAVTAPALLRHGGQALTPADIEAIVVDSAPDVVRARCLPRQGCSIVLAVAIRDTGQRCPTPSRARREGIARNILSAGWGALAPDAVVVLAPRYIGASVKAEVIAKSADAVADVEHAVRETLTRFLHPVEGGADGLGWPFGRRIWPSDLQRAVAGIAGLDRVIAMRIKAIAPGEDIAGMPLDGLVCVADADLNVIVHAPEGAA